MSESDLNRLAGFFQVLGSTGRLALLQQLQGGPSSVSELVTAIGLSQPLTSQHLRVLREAGMVSVRREGRTHIYELADHHIAHIVIDAVAHINEEDS